MVNEEKQIFHCFGCGEGGDVFAFLMKTGHFTFPEAVKELARRYGISLPQQPPSPIQKKEMAKRELLFRINQLAAEYFHHLLTQRREGEAARRYLSQRGVTESIIQEFRLGYAADRWDGLVEFLKEKKVPLELAWELGLILPKKKEGWYDVFRKRILFPVFDLHQRVVGFGGRAIGDAEPKYLNSSESSIFHKGEILYGLHAAKRSISERDEVILVEGYFDLLTLHQNGWTHSVATLGTALTVQHLRILKRYTKNIMTVFDPDPAGIQATLRTLPLFLAEEVNGKAVLLPEGEDPDTFLKGGHHAEFEKSVKGAISLIDFFFERLMKIHDPRSIDGRVNIAKEGLAMIQKIPDRIRKDFYIRTLAEKLDLKESVLYDMVRSPSANPKAREVFSQQRLKKEVPKSEEMVIRLMVHHPELISTVSAEGILDAFEDPLLQRLGEELVDAFQKKKRLDLTGLLERMEGAGKEKLLQYTFEESGTESYPREQMLRDCMEKIRQKKRKRDQDRLLRKIKEVEKQRDGEALEALLMEHQELVKKEKGTAKHSFRKS